MEHNSWAANKTYREATPTLPSLSSVHTDTISRAALAESPQSTMRQLQMQQRQFIRGDNFVQKPFHTSSYPIPTCVVHHFKVSVIFLPSLLPKYNWNTFTKYVVDLWSHKTDISILPYHTNSAYEESLKIKGAIIERSLCNVKITVWDDKSSFESACYWVSYSCNSWLTTQAHNL